MRLPHKSLLPLKVLHRFFVLPSRSAGLERAQIPSHPGLRIFLPRIQAIAGFKFSDHGISLSAYRQSKAQLAPPIKSNRMRDAW